MGPGGMRGRGWCPGGPWHGGRARYGRLIEPGLLYLLMQRPQLHGYLLIEELGKLGLTDEEIDPGAVYRTLRQLEAEGCVASTWDIGPAGPPRRVYVVTDEGKERLSAWAGIVRSRANALKRFSELLDATQARKAEE